MYTGIECRENCPMKCVKEKEIDEMHQAIFGNGDIRKGLRWKIESNTDFINAIKRIFWIIMPIALIGAGSAVVSLVLTVVRLSNGKIGL